MAFGSQYCPIDIDDEDTVLIPPKVKKRKVDAEVEEGEIQIIGLSENNTSEKLKQRKKSKNKKKYGNNILEKTSKISGFATRKSFKELQQKLISLESRLESLENCLERVSQVFFNKSFTLDSRLVPDETLDYISEEPAVVVDHVENVLENQGESVNVDNEHITLDRDASVEDPEPPVIDDPSSLNKFENCGTFENVDDIEQNNLHGEEVSVINVSRNVNEIENRNAVSKVETTHLDDSQNDEIFLINQADHLDSTSSVQETRGECNGLNENEELMMEHEEEPVDTKWHLLSLTSVKQEVSLHRDEEGRVLLFLSCAFQKFPKPSPSVAATSGVYLGDELKNEYNFTSDRKMCDVKVEAEIRAALFGIEMIKELYKNTSVKTSSVCLMVISSCAPLVKVMRQNLFTMVYPNYCFCLCETTHCKHFARRWASKHPIGANHQDTLPNLIMTMKDLKVHWCLVDNISKEEKNIFKKYSDVVKANVNEYFMQILK